MFCRSGGGVETLHFSNMFVRNSAFLAHLKMLFRCNVENDGSYIQGESQRNGRVEGGKMGKQWWREKGQMGEQVGDRCPCQYVRVELLYIFLAIRVWRFISSIFVVAPWDVVFCDVKNC